MDDSIDWKMLQMFDLGCLVVMDEVEICIV